MRIYRVEDENGHGPYRMVSSRTEKQRKLAFIMGEDHNDPAHPEPHKENVSYRYLLTGRCGFETKESLYSWFEDWLGELRDTNHRVVVYESTHEGVTFIRTPTQVVFTCASKVESFPL